MGLRDCLPVVPEAVPLGIALLAERIGPEPIKHEWKIITFVSFICGINNRMHVYLPDRC